MTRRVERTQELVKGGDEEGGIWGEEEEGGVWGGEEVGEEVGADELELEDDAELDDEPVDAVSVGIVVAVSDDVDITVE